MIELVVNLHMHTTYSDGHGSHEEIAQAALDAGVDVVIVTDHNVWVDGPAGYYRSGQNQTLLLVGEEIHDQARSPQKNHLLVFGAGKELGALAADPQRLIDAVHEAGGLSFLAHPFETASPLFGEPDLSWVDWQVEGYTGIELWNAMSEFKSLLRSKLHALAYAYSPDRIARGPSSESLAKWDELLLSGRRVVAIGGTDAHAFPGKMGPVKRIIFPYSFHFRTLNTHLLVQEPLSGDLHQDQSLVYDALQAGRAFIGYDLPAPTQGFNFTAQGKDKQAWMGDEISAENGVTLQIRLPRRAECQLLNNGEVVKSWRQRETCTYITSETGVYRVEVFIPYRGRRRGWIYSNPIYVR
jgi:hypothetical protein